MWMKKELSMNLWKSRIRVTFRHYAPSMGAFQQLLSTWSSRTGLLLLRTALMAWLELPFRVWQPLKSWKNGNSEDSQKSWKRDSSFRSVKVNAPYRLQCKLYSISIFEGIVAKWAGPGRSERSARVEIRDILQLFLQLKKDEKRARNTQAQGRSTWVCVI